MTAIIASLLPLAALSLMTALALAPWMGGASALTLAAALLPAATLHYLALRRPATVPTLAVLFVGLATDMVVAAPLGLWTTITALAWTIGLLQRPSAGERWKFGRWASHAIAMVICVATLGVLGEMLKAPVAPPQDLAIALAIMIAGYPLFASLMRLFDHDKSNERFAMESD